MSEEVQSSSALPPGTPPGTREIDGVLFPPIEDFPMDISKQVQQMKEMDVRDDDIFLCAIPKAGTHWVWEMVNMLLKGTADLDPKCKEAAMLEFLPLEGLTAMESPRILNSHFPFRLLPKQALEKKSKIIYVTRNAKDVSVSLFYHLRGMKGAINFTGDFEEFLREKFLLEQDYCPSWFFYTRDWEKVLEKHPDLNIITLNYEDMKEDILSNLQRLAAFLGVNASDQLLRQIAEACSLKSLRAFEKSKQNPLKQLFRDDFTMYRKGEVGDWKNIFTVAQNEKFDEFYAKMMKDSKLKFRETL